MHYLLLNWSLNVRQKESQFLSILSVLTFSYYPCLCNDLIQKKTQLDGPDLYLIYMTIKWIKSNLSGEWGILLLKLVAILRKKWGIIKLIVTNIVNKRNNKVPYLTSDP